MIYWPDIPFETSMLFKGVIIHCPGRDLAGELFSLLEENDIRWYGGESMGETHWHKNREDSCYRISPQGTITYGNRICYSRREYRNYIKCTFYRIATPDFETATEEELRSLLGI